MLPKKSGSGSNFGIQGKEIALLIYITKILLRQNVYHLEIIQQNTVLIDAIYFSEPFMRCLTFSAEIQSRKIISVSWRNRLLSILNTYFVRVACTSIYFTVALKNSLSCLKSLTDISLTRKSGNSQGIQPKV